MTEDVQRRLWKCCILLLVWCKWPDCNETLPQQGWSMQTAKLFNKHTEKCLYRNTVWCCIWLNVRLGSYLFPKCTIRAVELVTFWHPGHINAERFNTTTHPAAGRLRPHKPNKLKITFLAFRIIRQTTSFVWLCWKCSTLPACQSTPISPLTSSYLCHFPKVWEWMFKVANISYPFISADTPPSQHLVA